MNDQLDNPTTITGQINAKALELLEQNPEGVRWAQMRLMKAL